MTKKTNVRLMLVNKGNGKYIKSLGEVSFSEFLDLIINKEKENNIIIPDFIKIAEYFYNKLDEKFKQKENKDLHIKIKNSHDDWKELQSIKKDSSLFQSKIILLQDKSKETLNWIYTKLNDLTQEYTQINETNNSYIDKKVELLKNDFSNKVDSFIQILSYYIHTMCQVEISYFKNDTMLKNHCLKVRDIISDLLKKELTYYENDNFGWNSFIYYYYINNTEINTELLLKQINSNKKLDDIFNQLKVTIVNDYDYNPKKQKLEIDFEWTVPSDYQTQRIKMLSELIEKIEFMLLFLEQLRNEDINYSNDQNELNILENKFKSYIKQES